MQSKAPTVQQYLSELPADRRDAIEQVRRVITKNLASGFEEGMQYGMIGYYVPHSLYPSGYHCDPKQPLPFVSLASQKNHMAIYLFCIYNDAGQEQRLREEWSKSGKKLDMGKSCIRFRKVDDLPLDVIGRTLKRLTVKKFINNYETVIKTTGKRAASTDIPTTSPRKQSAKPPLRKSTKKKAVNLTAKRK